MPIGIINRQGMFGFTRLMIVTINRKRKPTPHSIKERKSGENLVMAKSAKGFEIPQLITAAKRIA
jgi:hypothetical protein